MTPRPPLAIPHRDCGRPSREHMIAAYLGKRPRERTASDFFDLEDIVLAHRVETKSAIAAAIVNRRNR